MRLGGVILLLFTSLLSSCSKSAPTSLAPPEQAAEDSVGFYCTATLPPAPDGEDSPIHGLTLQLDTKWANGRTLRVRFLSGTAFQQQQVQTIAPTWSNFANIRFAIVASDPSDIRVAFNSNGINNSYIGDDALRIPTEDATMNLSFDGSTSAGRIRRVILHEFGHALGMRHEHQHPEGGIQWNREVVYADHVAAGWTRDDVDDNVFEVAKRNETNFSQYDPTSIMHYPIPAHWTTNGFSAPNNTVLSAMDQCFIGELYPAGGDLAFRDFGFGVRGGEGWYVGDFNGDRKDDILRYLNENGGAEVALSNGSSFRAPVQWSGFGVRGGEGWYIGDFNGDGKDDILRYLNEYGGAEVGLSTGSSFRSLVKWSGSGVRGGAGWYVGDFNGDGKDDILRYLNENGGAEVALSRGTSFRAPVQWSGFGVRGGEGWYVGDFNGDGKDDILRYLNEYGGAEVALSTGASFRAPVRWSGFGERGGEGWYVGRFNGDRMSDVVRLVTSNTRGAQVLASSGSRFGSPTTWNEHAIAGGNGWYVGDYDGDGVSDLLRYLNSNGGAVVYLSAGGCLPSFD